MSYQLEALTIGEHNVTFKIERLGAAALKVIAMSDSGGTAEGSLSLHPKHDQTEDGLLIELKRFAAGLAQEAAGHGQSKTLLDKYFPPDT
jgi:hypothetical protein